ncbi:MAG TPA: hypothetical protein VHE37_04830 [Nevskiaceae bacterium]|nr:hypothetical protein [Nevskiaceae bacterium]
MPAHASGALDDGDLRLLRDLARAEDDAQPAPAAFVDSLVRLSRAGCVRGDAQRTVRVTDRGRQFLRDCASPSTVH